MQAYAEIRKSVQYFLREGQFCHDQTGVSTLQRTHAYQWISERGRRLRDKENILACMGCIAKVSRCYIL